MSENQRQLFKHLIFSPCISVILALCGLLLVTVSTEAQAPPPLSFVWNDGFSDRTRALAWGDYDLDRDLDLAVGNENGPNRVFRNTNGSLTLAWTSPLEDNTQAIAWGDVNGDGYLDLAVGNNGQPNRVYRNQQGALTLMWTAPYTEATLSLAWGDADGDGDVDLLIGNSGANRLYYNDNGVLVGSGWEDPFAAETHDVAWIDIDGDGDLDLITGNAGRNHLYRNDNGVLVDAEWTDPFAEATRSVAWGDYDKDGDFDLLVGNYLYPNRIYRNEGGVLVDGGWQDPQSEAATQDARWGDIDGDGDLDVVFGEEVAANRLFWNQNGAFVASDWEDPFARATQALALGDYDNDGDLDIMTAADLAPNDLYRNNGGVLQLADWYLPLEERPTCGAWGDIDEDGGLDLILCQSYAAPRLYLNTDGILEDSGWTAPYTDTTVSIAWGDYDGDGHLDLAVGTRNINAHSPTWILRNDGVGNLVPVWASPENNPAGDVAWGDYDNDGDLDLAVGNYPSDDAGSFHEYVPSRIYRNDGETWTLVWESEAQRDQVNNIAWGDLKGDGDLDLVVANDKQPNRIYENVQDTFELLWSAPERDYTSRARWGDVDGDGDLDLVVGNWLDQIIRLYRNDDGTLVRDEWVDPAGAYVTDLAGGDVDNDGDLDLAAGNLGANFLYGNIGGELQDIGWRDPVDTYTWYIDWVDIDMDGDLDLVTGDAMWLDPDTQRLRLYENHLIGQPLLPNQPTVVHVHKPGHTADAFGQHTSEVLIAPVIPITYTLKDSESDPVRRIDVYFSSNGGGHWLPATPTSDTQLSDLPTTPTGTEHVFYWDAAADLIKDDNIVIRMVPHSNPDYVGEIHHPALGGQSFPFRVQTALRYAKVIDDAGKPVSNAIVYRDGGIITDATGAPRYTDAKGLLHLGATEPGQALIALSPSIHEHPTVRAAHAGWAYRVHLTSLNLDADGTPHPHIVTQSGEQLLTLQKDQPLILLNLVASIEWDATLTYTQQISRAFRSASDYLYDLTDGQMALGHVTIYDNAEHWADADVQFSANNVVWPHAYVGGLTSEDTFEVIRLGRAWDGQSGNQGPWDAPEGYRTLTHELGHYALHLYDEYFAYTFDAQGHLTGETRAYCTGPENRTTATDATNASVMDYQYTSSELSARDVSGLWSSLCEYTAQWQLNGESPWETVIRMYTDSVTPPRWHLTSPIDRGTVMSGPESLSMSIPGLPQIDIAETGHNEPPKTLTVTGPEGPYEGAIVALYKQDGRVIGQGFSSNDGTLEIYGAAAGDTLRAASVDGALAGSATVAETATLDLSLAPVSSTALQTTVTNPHLRLIAEPGPMSDSIDITVSLYGLDAGTQPLVYLTPPGAESAQALVVQYSSTTGAHRGTLTVNAQALGQGKVHAVGEAGSRLVHLQTTYRLQQITRADVHDVYAADGNLRLHLAPGSIPGENAYVIVTPPGALPGPLPEGWTLIGDAYDVTASGALVVLDTPAALRARHDPALLADRVPETLRLHRWDPGVETWEAVTATLDAAHDALVATVTRLGTYALLAPTTPSQTVFLPLVMRE